MSENKHSTNFCNNSNGPQPVRKQIVITGFLAVVLAILFASKLFHGHHSESPSLAPADLASQDKITPATSPLPQPALHSQFRPEAIPAVASSSAEPIAADKLTPEQLVDELTKIGVGGPITPEQAARFKADLNELIQRGPASVAAIQAFLAKNVDMPYRDVPGGDQLGFASLRTGMIDTLKQIGGPEAQSALATTLQTTAAPAELMQIAAALNQMAPGQYRDQILAAAQETLKMAANNQLGTNAELAPLLKMVQAYGAPGSMADAAKNNPTEFASAIQLANLPNGQGVSALAKMAEDTSSGNQLMATEMIAQLAGQNSDALNTLAQLVQDGKVQAGDWNHLAPLLGGDQYQLDASGQKYSVVSSDMTPDQVSQRLMLIDTFMTYLPDGSGGQKALAQERSILAARMTSN